MGCFLGYYTQPELRVKACRTPKSCPPILKSEKGFVGFCMLTLKVGRLDLNAIPTCLVNSPNRNQADKNFRTVI